MPTFVITMTIHVNDTEIVLNDGKYSVASLLEHISVSAVGCAVAVNNVIVPAVRWDDTEVKENDKITLIRATQGG